MPVELKPDGSIETMNEYVQLEFTECNELPAKQDNSIDYSFFTNNLNINTGIKLPLQQEQEQEQEQEQAKPEQNDFIYISKEEIKEKIKKTLNNSSFKTKHKPFNANRITAKSR